MSDLAPLLSLGSTESSHRGSVRCIAWDSCLASGGDDATVRFWNPQSGELVCSIEGPEPVTSIAWFKTFELAAADRMKKIRVMSPATGSGEAFGGPDDDPAIQHEIALLGGGIAASSSTLSLWHLERGRELRKLAGFAPADEFGAIAASPDGALLVAGRNMMVHLGGPLARWAVWQRPWDEPAWVPDWENNAATIAFAPNGVLLASAGYGDTDIRVRAVSSVGSTWSIAAQYAGHQASVSKLAFSPDSCLLASAGMDGTIRLWDLARDREVRRYAGHEGGVTALAFSPDGAKLATGGADGSLLIWTV